MALNDTNAFARVFGIGSIFMKWVLRSIAGTQSATASSSTWAITCCCSCITIGIIIAGCIFYIVAVNFDVLANTAHLEHLCRLTINFIGSDNCLSVDTDNY